MEPRAPKIVNAPSFESASEKELENFSQVLEREMPSECKVGVQATTAELENSQAEALVLLREFAKRKKIMLIPLRTPELDSEHLRALDAFSQVAANYSSSAYAGAYARLTTAARAKETYALKVIERHKPTHLVLNLPLGKFKIPSR